MNPFIRLLTDPITTLTLTGYLLLMTAIVFVGTGFVARMTTVLALSTRRTDRQMGNGRYNEWWGDYAGGWLPPSKWSIHALAALGVAVVVLWALATVVYIAT